MTWYQNVSFLSLRIYFAKLWTNYKIKMSSSAGNTLKNGSWPVGSKNYFPTTMHRKQSHIFAKVTQVSLSSKPIDLIYKKLRHLVMRM